MTDSNGCTATTTGTITQPSAVTASSSNTAILCNGGNAVVTVSAEWRDAWIHWHGDLQRSSGHVFLHGDRFQWLHGDDDRHDHSAQRGDSQLVQHGDSVQRR